MRRMTSLRLTVIVVLAAGGICLDAMADDCDVFVETYGGASDEVANSIVNTQDGGIVIAGYVDEGGANGRDALLAKLDAQGNVIWKQVYGGTEDDEWYSVIETHDGYLIVVGYAMSYSQGGADFLLGKFNTDGNRQWTRTWGDDGNDTAYEVIEASDHTLWMAGCSTSFSGDEEEVVLARIAADGSVLTGGYAGNPAVSWSYCGRALAEVFDTAGFCVTGWVEGPLGNRDILLIKFNHSAEYLWAKAFQNDDHTPSDEVAKDLVRTSDACLALTGTVDYNDGVYNSEGAFVLKTDVDADLDWARFVSGVGWYGSRRLESLIETDAGLVVAGKDHYSVMHEDQVALAKLSLGGTLLWSRANEIGDGCAWNSVAADADNCLLAAGSTAGYGRGGDEMLLGRYDDIGLTCLDDDGGLAFSAWSPSEYTLLPSDDQFNEATSDWNHPVDTQCMTVTPVCPDPVVLTVCSYGSPDFTAIQDAIDAAGPGDIVELCDDTFAGVGNRDLDFHGKSITVQSASGDPSTCIVDCQVLGRGFYFHSCEMANSVVKDITISNGSETHGGGIYCDEASPTVTGCVLSGNSASYGGAIRCDDSSATFTDCIISGNTATLSGGAVRCWNSSPVMNGCVIAGNSAVYDGGGVYSSGDSVPEMTGCVIVGNAAGDDGGGLSTTGDSAPVVTSCTISGNFADDLGGGIYQVDGHPIFRRTILWDNCTTAGPGSGDEWYGNGGVRDFCCGDWDLSGVDGAWTMLIACSSSIPNIDEEPMFCDSEPCDSAPTTDGDYHLHRCSPCADDPHCGVIGALDVDPTCQIHVVSVESWRLHDEGGPGQIELPVPLGWGDAGGQHGDNVEPRAYGIKKLIVTLDGAAPLTCTSAVACFNRDGPVDYTGAISCAGRVAEVDQLTVEFDPALPDQACCEVTMSCVDDSVCVAGLMGDCNQDGDVNSLDYSCIKLRLNRPAEDYPQADCNVDGEINSLDYSCVKLRLGHVIPDPCPP